MKKIIFVLALICMFSLVTAIEAEPYSKESFKEKMDRAVEYNRTQTNIPNISFFPEGTEEYKDALKEQQQIIASLEKLDQLKEKAIKEYSIFFDAYHASDSKTVKEQTPKLETILIKEMNPLMKTIVKFDGIYNNIFFWSVQLDYYINNGIIIDPDKLPIDNSKPIQADKTKVSGEVKITDCCIAEPEGKCCKAKKSAECCAKDPNSACCLQKPAETDLLLPILGALVVFVIVIVALVFVRR